jgi:hypothetical protein
MDVTYHFDYMSHSYKIMFRKDLSDKVNETYFVDFAVWHDGRYSFSISFKDGVGFFDKVITYIKEFKAERFKIKPSSESRYRLFRILLKKYSNDFDIQEYKNEFGKDNFLLIKKTNENLRIIKFKDFKI